MCDLNATKERLDGMSREEFRKTIMEGVGSSYAFSKLAIGGPTVLIKSDWRLLQEGFRKAGLPENLTTGEAHELAMHIAKKIFDY